MQIAAHSPTPVNLFSELLRDVGYSLLQNFPPMLTRTLLSLKRWLESWPELSLPLGNPLKLQI